MLVETYECQETAAEPIEASEEAVRLIEELGLAGQKAMLTPGTEKVPAPGRLPYSQATAEQIFVFRVLCPRDYKLKDYNRTPIPLRVLQIASHAQSLGFFDELVVWDATSADEKDPVLVGLKKNAQWTWQNDSYLLARWGEELESWPTLLKRALAKKREQVAAIAEGAVRKAKAFLMDGVSLSDEELIQKGFDWSPTFGRD
jgi:hypothetical protein